MHVANWFLSSMSRSDNGYRIMSWINPVDRNECIYVEEENYISSSSHHTQKQHKMGQRPKFKIWDNENTSRTCRENILGNCFLGKTSKILARKAKLDKGCKSSSEALLISLMLTFK